MFAEETTNISDVFLENLGFKHNSDTNMYVYTNGWFEIEMKYMKSHDWTGWGYRFPKLNSGWNTVTYARDLLYFLCRGYAVLQYQSEH